MEIDIDLTASDFSKYGLQHLNNSRLPDIKTRMTNNLVFGCIYMCFWILAWLNYLGWASILITSLFFLMLYLVKTIHTNKAMLKKLLKQHQDSKENYQYKLVFKKECLMQVRKNRTTIYKKNNIIDSIENNDFLIIKTSGITEILIPKNQLINLEQFKLFLNNYLISE